MLTAGDMLARGHLALDWAAALVTEADGFEGAEGQINAYYKSVIAFTSGGRVVEARKIAGMAEAHHRAALRAHQILGSDAHGPAQPRRLRHDLVKRVHGFGAADARNRRHLGARGKELHAKGDGPQPQKPLQIGG